MKRIVKFVVHNVVIHPLLPIAELIHYLHERTAP